MQANSTHTAPETLHADEDSSALLYRPALLVFYASLISSYLVVRFLMVSDRWPTRQELRLDITWAAIGTVVLVLSGLTIVLAKRAARSGLSLRTRQWLMLTWLLGIGFVLIQANEFRRRWQQNLIPAPFSNLLHDRADLYFLSAVQQRLMQLATEINKDKVRQNQLVQQVHSPPEQLSGDRTRLEAELRRLESHESLRAERLGVINRFLVSETRWTSFVVATTDDLATQRMAIAALAYDILPHRSFSQSHQQFRQLESKQLDVLQTTIQQDLLSAEVAAKENSEPLKGLLSAVAEVKAVQQELESQLKSHLRQRAIDEDSEDPPQQDADPKRIALEGELADVQKRFEERNAKLTEAAKLVTDAEDKAARLSEELRSISARQGIIVELDSVGAGLNQKYPWLRLPVCIPAGTAWAWTYFLLVAVHSIHLAYVLLAVLVLALSRQLSLTKAESIVRNWSIMVIIWCILFVLIY